MRSTRLIVLGRGAGGRRADGAEDGGAAAFGVRGIRGGRFGVVCIDEIGRLRNSATRVPSALSSRRSIAAHA